MNITFETKSRMGESARRRERRVKLFIILMTCINVQHIDCYCILKGIMERPFFAIVHYYLFYDGSIWYTRSHCRFSDTQVSVKVHGPLVRSMKSDYLNYCLRITLILGSFNACSALPSNYLLMFHCMKVFDKV